jgi:hypothetical protein
MSRSLRQSTFVIDLNIPKVSSPVAFIFFPIPGKPANTTDFPFGGIDGGKGPHVCLNG